LHSLSFHPFHLHFASFRPAPSPSYLGSGRLHPAPDVTRTPHSLTFVSCLHLKPRLPRLCLGCLLSVSAPTLFPSHHFPTPENQFNHNPTTLGSDPPAGAAAAAAARRRSPAPALYNWESLTFRCIQVTLLPVRDPRSPPAPPPGPPGVQD
jgi:hypothetical protein